MRSWLDFWNAPNAIYVNRRHQEAHYAKVLAGVSGLVPTGSNWIVLDWGCSDALGAPQLAQRCRTLLLYEPAETTRRRLVSNYHGRSNIRVLGEQALASIAPASVDFIVVNSVVQYLSRQQFIEALQLFRRLLKREGKLLLGDIIAPDTPLAKHVATFLRFAWQNGFFLAGVQGLAQNFISPYRKLRRSAGYATYTTDQVLALLSQNGFVAERLRSNIAVSQLRSSFLAQKQAADDDPTTHQARASA
jgi:hypothetical protein